MSASTLIALWKDIGACVARAGVRKLVLYNSHGGQMAVMDIVARDLRESHDMMVVAANWYTLGLPEGLFTRARRQARRARRRPRKLGDAAADARPRAA